MTCYLLLRSLASAPLEIIFTRSNSFLCIRLTCSLIIFVLLNFIPIKHGSRWLSDDSQPPKGAHNINIVRNCPKFGRTKSVWENLIDCVSATVPARVWIETLPPQTLSYRDCQWSISTTSTTRTLQTIHVITAELYQSMAIASSESWAVVTSKFSRWQHL